METPILMHTLTRAQFDVLPIQYGGDLWNPSLRWRRAWQAIPEAVEMSHGYVSTGLWLDVTGILPDGSAVTRRIYD